MITKRIFPIIEINPKDKNRLSNINRSIDNMFEQGKIKEANNLKNDSVKRLTILYGPWLCNFKCPNYCYTKGTSDGVLTSAQTKEVIEQAKEIGAKATYWPGDGEMTLLKSFWGIMDYQARQELPAVIFTNGSIFQDDRISIGVLDMKSDDLIRKLNKEYSKLHFYIKFWNSDPVKAAEMAGVNKKEYPYETLQNKKIPLALAKLISGIDKERLGVEVMVSKENYHDVTENIIPTIDELGIYGYIEPVIFSGNAKDKQNHLLLNHEQHQHLSEFFSSGGNYCEKRQSTELIVKGSRLTPGIAIPPRTEDSIINKSGRVKDIFTIFHNEYFRKMRKRSEELNGCLCRNYLANLV